MAAVGRPPKPTTLKIIEGNPGRRPLNRNEPKPRPVAPPCPTWLDLEAKREWKRISIELDRVGLLTIVDRAALAGYCQTWSRWRDAEMVLSAQGMTFETPNGYVQQRPEVSIAQKSLQLVAKFCTEFGLTPSARSRLTVPGTDDASEDSPFDV